MKPIVKLVMVTLEHTTLVFLPPLHRFKLGMGLECRGCFLFHHQHLTVHGILLSLFLGCGVVVPHVGSSPLHTDLSSPCLHLVQTAFLFPLGLTPPCLPPGVNTQCTGLDKGVNPNHKQWGAGGMTQALWSYVKYLKPWKSFCFLSSVFHCLIGVCSQ